METVWSVWWKMKSWNSSVIILCHEHMCVLQDNKKLTEKFIKIKENGKSCDANISSQQTAQNVITGALEMKLAETSKVRSRLSDKAVQRSNLRPGTIIPFSKLEHCLDSADQLQVPLCTHKIKSRYLGVPLLPSTLCSRFGADGCNLSAGGPTARFEGLMKEQEKPPTLMTNLHNCTAVSEIFSAGIYNHFSFVWVMHIITPSWVEINVKLAATQLSKLLLKARFLQQKAICLILALIQTLGCFVQALQATGAVAFAYLQAVRDTKYQNIQPSAQFLIFSFLCSSVPWVFLGSSVSRCRGSWNPSTVINQVWIQALRVGKASPGENC